MRPQNRSKSAVRCGPVPNILTALDAIEQLPCGPEKTTARLCSLNTYQYKTKETLWMSPLVHLVAGVKFLKKTVDGVKPSKNRFWLWDQKKESREKQVASHEDGLMYYQCTVLSHFGSKKKREIRAAKQMHSTSLRNCKPRKKRKGVDLRRSRLLLL